MLNDQSCQNQIKTQKKKIPKLKIHFGKHQVITIRYYQKLYIVCHMTVNIYPNHNNCKIFNFFFFFCLSFNYFLCNVTGM